MSKQYVMIENAGEVETAAFTLMGASTKRDDNAKIGFFGSGNKYAIAYLLRNDINFVVFSGEKQVKIEKEPVSLRGQQFDAIKIDDHITGLTTEAGPDWQAWQVFRELFCNALDEGRCVVKGDILNEDVIGVSGRTRVFIDKGSSVGDILNDFDKYFTHDRVPLHNTPFGKIFIIADIRGAVYRQGVRVSNSNPFISTNKFPFDIDLNKAEITELRMLNPASIDNDVQFFNLFWSIDNDEIINTIITQNVLCNITYVPHHTFNLSDAWKRVLSDCVVYIDKHKPHLTEQESAKGLRVSPRMYSYFKESKIPEITFPRCASTDNDPYIVVDHVSAGHARKLDQVCKVLSYHDCPITPSDITVATFDDTSILGMYDSKKDRIVIADKAFIQGISDLTVTVLEEYLHKKTGCTDFTRAFQDAMLRLSVTLMETYYKSE